MLNHEFPRTATIAAVSLLLATVTLFATLSALAAEPLAYDNVNSACHAQLAAIHTNFPQALQSRGEHGAVKLSIAIDKVGRATSTQVTQSSGYASLDKASADSVLQDWRFDVSHCTSAAAPADAVVTIKFQRAPRFTVSGTRNTRVAHLITDSQAANRCDVARDNTGDAVVACLSDVALAGRTGAPRLADRIAVK